MQFCIFSLRPFNYTKTKGVVNNWFGEHHTDTKVLLGGKMKKTLILPICACLFGSISTSGFAAALGDLNVASFLGQRLSGTVELIQPVGQDLPISCFRAVKPENAASQNLPWLAKIHVNLQRRTGQARLLLTSSQSIDEPMLALAIQIGCGIDVTREYLLMLSPAPSTKPTELTPAKAVSRAATPPDSSIAGKTSQKPLKQAHPTHTWIIGDGESVSGLASALYPENAKMRKAFTQAVFQANPDLVMEYSSRDLLPPGLVLVVPDLQNLANSPAAIAASSGEIIKPAHDLPASRLPVPDQRYTAQQLPERSSDRLVVSEVTDATAYPGDLVVHERAEASRQELLQLHRFINTALPPSNDTDTAELIALQRRMAVLQETLEQIRLAEKRIEIPSSPLPPVAEVKQMPLERTALPETAILPANKNPALSTNRDKLILGVGTGTLGIVLGLTFAYLGQNMLTRWRRRPASGQVDETGLEINLNKPPASPRRSALDTISSPSETGTLPDVQIADPMAYSDIADFLLKTGHMAHAAEFFRDFVDATPEAALTPWLKLLLTYQRLGSEAEFRWVAQQLKERFNVNEIRWEDGPEQLERVLGGNSFISTQDGAQSIEAMPHVCRKIGELWGTPACYRYLEDLLRDNRGGDRDGLSLPVIQEVILLMQILQSEGSTTKRII